MTSRRGRKRKWRGQKLPGTAKPERAPDDRVRASRQPHRRNLPEADRLDERAESPLGQLALRGVIDDPQYQAGVRYAVIIGEYRAVIGTPRAMAGNGSGFVCWGDALCALEPERCACRIRKAHYLLGLAALYRAGYRAAKVVAKVAVYREDVAADEIPALRHGLMSLANHFGLTARTNGRILAITHS